MARSKKTTTNPDAMKRRKLQSALDSYKSDKKAAVAVTCSPDADELQQPDVFVQSNNVDRETVRMALALAWGAVSIAPDIPPDAAGPIYWAQRSQELLIVAHNQLAREMQAGGAAPSIAHLLLLARMVESSMTMSPNKELADLLDLYTSKAEGKQYDQDEINAVVRKLYEATEAFMAQDPAAHNLANVLPEGSA